MALQGDRPARAATISRLLSWLPAMAAVAALLFLTLQPPDETTELSGSFQRWLLSLWPEGQAPAWGKDSHLIRSFAHVPEFFILGCCFFVGFRFCTGRPVLWTILTCCGIGLLDEGLKYWLPTREFDMMDWGLDAVGVLLASGLMTLIFTLFRRRGASPD